MKSSDKIKLASAFAAGVVVALGSALIYVNANQLSSNQGMEPQTAAQTPATSRDISAAASPGAEKQTEPIPRYVEPDVKVRDEASLRIDALADRVEKEQVEIERARKAAAEHVREGNAASPANAASNVRPEKRVGPSSSEQYSSPAPRRAPAQIYGRVSSGQPVAPQLATTVPVPPAAAGPTQPQESNPGPSYPAVASSLTPAASSTSLASSTLATSTTAGLSLPENAPSALPRQPRTITIASGTNLAVRLSQPLNTEHNQSGDTFRAALENPIILEGAIIADRGSRVVGRVITVQKAGRVEGVADLTLALTEINTTDGQRISIATDTFDKKGPKSTTQDAEKIGGGAALGAIIGALAGGGKGAAIGAGAGGAAGTGTVLATRGKAAVLPNESRLTFRLSAPVTITERLNTGQ